MNLKKPMWDNLVESYKKCEACPIGKNAKHHVFGKGSLDPGVVFIGEGPGKLEDVEGLPFVGMAGQLLNAALVKANVETKCFFTNLVCCRPCDELGASNRAPSDQEIFNCSDRLQKTLFITAPRVVVLLGRVPRMALVEKPFLRKYKLYCLEHPAYVLRQGGIKSPAFDRFTIKLKEALNASL